MTPREALGAIVMPGLALLPAPMRSTEAKVMLIAIAQQESGLVHRWQVVDLNHPEFKGPARGLWMFERSGGVYGTFNHPATRFWVRELCRVRNCLFTVHAIWLALETDDVLAAGMARLLLFTDARPLPKLGDEGGALNCYLRIWRPGKPKPKTWPKFYQEAMECV